MTAYTAPTRDMQFVINELAGLPAVAALPAFAEQDVNAGLVEAVLEEAAALPASHTWQQALQAAEQANNAGHQGHSDWRVPNRTELESTVDLAVPGTGAWTFW